MRLRFILAILILLFACALQFWFASANVFINFILASLIVFAFFFDIWELLVFVLFAVFVVNWQPSASVDIIVFGLIPIVAYGFNKIVGWRAWAGVPTAIVGGFIILYLAIAPRMFFADWELFLMDLFGSLVFGGMVFFLLERLKPASQ
jgi:hypothetical protein